MKSDFAKSDPKTNIFIGVFTTSQARLKLYEVLEKLDTNVIYMDTDSVVYVSREGEYDPPTGPFLGDLTSELTCTGVGCSKEHTITAFLSCGPKNYAYKTDTNNVTCKIKGFNLNYNNSQFLNFDTMKDIVLNDHTKKITTNNPRKIIRDKLKHKIITRNESKSYSFVFDKRIILGNLDTQPFGYNRC